MADKNYYSIADQSDILLGSTEFPDKGINAQDYSDTLKLSHAKYITVKCCYITGGKEDCIDINRMCENILIEDTTLFSGGSYCVTIKGGSKNITLKNVTIDGHGKETDIDIGNWSDQSSELTTGVVLDNVQSRSGEPVKVRVLWANKPIIINNSNVSVTTIPKCLVSIYRFLRKLKLVP